MADASTGSLSSCHRKDTNVVGIAEVSLMPKTRARKRGDVSKSKVHRFSLKEEDRKIKSQEGLKEVCKSQSVPLL